MPFTALEREQMLEAAFWEWPSVDWDNARILWRPCVSSTLVVIDHSGAVTFRAHDVNGWKLAYDADCQALWCGGQW